ncbi:GIY-YIG nuclease family protein [Methanobrevibacter arboriphilus]|uniref:Uncharacterized protein n=1 Tax=Methanobrevibacter arboriphilus TaxID=39441 RepID=A0ACA8R171_METAZ|nr:GIY-YIG nuclease family protein [Methanobrevibacter arboriphilus]BBL61192.1 hypothetical protein MarbSA_02320 [Methanobrevibacter arboriphilus]
MKGSYCLIIHKEKSSKIEVGAIGSAIYKEGFYVYIGSAMNSLIPRIKRHLSNEKKIRWHIDYLLKDNTTKIGDIIFTISEKKVECSLANFISKNGEEKENFGCSDCKCKSHLIYFSNKDFCIDTVKKAYENQEINFYNLEYFKSLEK